MKDFEHRSQSLGIKSRESQAHFSHILLPFLFPFSSCLYQSETSLLAKIAGFRRYEAITAGIFSGMKQVVYLYWCIGRYGTELTSLINDHDLYDISKKECIKSLVLQTTRLYHHLLSHEAHRCPCLILEELYNCDKLKAHFFWLVYKREIAESVANTHYVVNRVAHLIAAESYHMVFIEGILLQGHSAIGTKKHDVPGRCWYIMGKFYIRSH